MYFYSDNHGSLEPSAAEQDPMRQHFSLATHPTLPIVLFSDGFLVTVVQLPVDVNTASMMRDLVLGSAKYLKKVYEQENLDMTVADAYKLSKGKTFLKFCVILTQYYMGLDAKKLRCLQPGYSEISQLSYTF